MEVLVLAQGESPLGTAGMDYNCSMQRQDAKSLALFQAIQSKLSRSEEWRRYLIEAKEWAEEVYKERPNDIYLAEWTERIDDALTSVEGLDRLYGFMLSTEQHAIDMRSSSPFAGISTTKERTDVLVEFQRKWVS